MGLGEAYDDSLKQLFQADESYANGNVAKAVAYLESQTRDRLPIINEKAIKECSVRPAIPIKDLQRSLDDIKTLMLKERPYSEVHQAVMATDKKFALKGYYSFCRCNSNE